MSYPHASGASLGIHLVQQVDWSRKLLFLQQQLQKLPTNIALRAKCTV